MSTDESSGVLNRRIQSLRAERGDRVSIDAVAKMVASIMSTMRGDVTADYLQVYEELDALAMYIDNGKAKFDALCSAYIRDHHLPAAADQLNAIVAANEEATNTILEATEIIATKAKELNEPEITEQVTRIFEASSFQDLTGQRTSKVIANLKYIEDHINQLIFALFGEETDEKHQTKPQRDMNSEDALLNGPQLPGKENKQADIDALLASSD